MRCKKHPADHSSGVGVCASCLRERLVALIAAQAQVQAHAHAQVQVQQALEDRRKFDIQPPPLVFPRSVSPYITRRKSDTAAWQHPQQGLPDQRFYSTPQAGPTGSIALPESYKKRQGRFSFLSSLFRSKSEKLDSDPRAPVSASDARNPCNASSSSPSWFSNILSGRRRNKQTETFFLDESTTGCPRRPSRFRDRGMSPARFSEGEEFFDGSSGYSSESSQGWRQTPGRAVPPTRRRAGHGLNVSGLAFCLSPLVRASPSRHWNQKGVPPEIETRMPAKPHPSTATSFCKNRSRKLTDFGRVNHNR